MSRKLVCWLLSALMALALCPAAVLADGEGGEPPAATEEPPRAEESQKEPDRPDPTAGGQGQPTDTGDGEEGEAPKTETPKPQAEAGEIGEPAGPTPTADDGGDPAEPLSDEEEDVPAPQATKKPSPKATPAPDPSDKGTFCGRPAHTHSEACYEDGKLICGRKEHTHTLACYADPTADVETEADWKKTFASVTLTGDWTKDLVAIARTQLGYTESKRNYIVTKDGKKKGYTRYGDWAGSGNTLYADWCAGFVAFCMHYANIDLPTSFSCVRFRDNLAAKGLFRETGEYRPKAGDIVFFAYDGSLTPTHVGIVTGATGAKIETIEGNQTKTNKVDRFSYATDDPAIVGYGELPRGPKRDTPKREAPAATQAPARKQGSGEPYRGPHSGRIEDSAPRPS